MKTRFIILFVIICGIIGTLAGVRFTHNHLFSIPNITSFSFFNHPVSPPITMAIPKYRISTHIESVGLDSKGRMDIPRDWHDVAWYNRGPSPGTPGNAVIDGHVDNPNGAPAVFWNIKNLVPGDAIQTTDANGNTYTFKVTSVKEYTLDKIPLKDIFNPNSSTSHLNLITCAGIWDHNQHEYLSRTVVYSDLVK